jgi:hypothetical protein
MKSVDILHASLGNSESGARQLSTNWACGMKATAHDFHFFRVEAL